MEGVLVASKIVSVRTLGTQFDNNCVEVIDDEAKVYRIKSTELLKIISEHDWLITLKTKHRYLTLNE